MASLTTTGMSWGSNALHKCCSCLSMESFPHLETPVVKVVVQECLQPAQPPEQAQCRELLSCAQYIYSP